MQPFSNATLGRHQQIIDTEKRVVEFFFFLRREGSRSLGVHVVKDGNLKEECEKMWLRDDVIFAQHQRHCN